MTNGFLAIAWGMRLKHCSALSRSYLVCSLLSTDLHHEVVRTSDLLRKKVHLTYFNPRWFFVGVFFFAFDEQNL